METSNPIVLRAQQFDETLSLIMSMPEVARLPVVKALVAYFDNKPYAEILFEECDR